MFLFLIAISLGSLNAQVDTSKFNKKAAIEYNNYIINEQLKVTDAMKNLTLTLVDDNLGEVNKYYQCLIDTSKTVYNRIKKLKSFNKNKEFRNSAKKLFAFYYKTSKGSTNDLLKIVTKTEEISDTEKKKLEKINAQITKKEQRIYSAFMQAQKKFSEENKFSIK